MDLEKIILAVFGLLGGIDLLRLLFIKQDRKKKDIENEKDSAEARDKELETARHANDLLVAQLNRANETIADKEKTIKAKDDLLEEKSQKIAKLVSTVTALFDDMCVHKGCRIRKPHQGQGALWYENYRNDPSLGADNLSIDTLIKQDRANRIKIERAADEEVKEVVEDAQ